MQTLVTILHVLVCIFLMLTVLLQAGKGGGMGAAFGGGSSMGTVFGGSGAGNFLRRLTVTAAIIFMFTSMILAWMATPSTDPLKKYWAREEAASSEKERAHQDALKGSAPASPGENAPGAAAGASTAPTGKPEAGPPATAPNPSDSSRSAAPKPSAGSSSAAPKPNGSSAAPKPSDKKPAAAPKPAEGNPGPASSGPHP